MKITKTDKVLIIMTLVILNLIFTWSLDISVSALISNGYVTNGFFDNSPMVSYHVALYGKLFSMIILSFLSVIWLTKTKIIYRYRIQK